MTKIFAKMHTLYFSIHIELQVRCKFFVGVLRTNWVHIKIKGDCVCTGPVASLWYNTCCATNTRVCKSFMMTSSSGKKSASLAICAGNSPVTVEFPAQRPVTRGFDVFYDLRPNERLSKQSWVWWFETPSRPLWRHSYALQRNEIFTAPDVIGLVYHASGELKNVFKLCETFELRINILLTMEILIRGIQSRNKFQYKKSTLHLGKKRVHLYFAKIKHLLIFENQTNIKVYQYFKRYQIFVKYTYMNKSKNNDKTHFPSFQT